MQAPPAVLSATTVVVNAALRAMAYDEPVMVLLRAGGRIGPAYVVERIAKQQPRNGTTVTIGLHDGQRIHLGDVERIRDLDAHDAPPPPRRGPTRDPRPLKARP